MAEFPTPATTGLLFGLPDAGAHSRINAVVATLIIIVVLESGRHFLDILPVPRHCCRRDRFISWAKLMVESIALLGGWLVDCREVIGVNVDCFYASSGSVGLLQVAKRELVRAFE